ncbi:MAG: DUF4342 domain-containing protein [Eubacteriales bacterium]|nr:DUF4342 domain-containing protein [Eubacteriales bacterium]
MIDPEKVRQVIEQTGAGEKDARSALETSDGDVAIAVRIIRSYRLREEAAGQEQAKARQSAPAADEILSAIKEIWKRGNASRLDIAKNGRVVLSVSLVVGTIGFVLAPVAALIGLGTALITDYTITVVMDDGTVINVCDFAANRKKETPPDEAADE